MAGRLTWNCRTCRTCGRFTDCAGGFLFPGHRRQAGVDFLHRDAAVHGADERAQIAAYTFLFDDSRDVNFHAVGIVFAVGVVLRGAFDALVRAVFAGDVTELAADAKAGVNFGDDFVIQVEVAPIHYVGDRAAAEIFGGAVAVVVHVGGEAVGHIFDDAKTVVHGRGADLHAGGAEGDVFRGVLPIADAADADDGNFHFFGDAGK